jgi:hypothetical protein
MSPRSHIDADHVSVAQGGQQIACAGLRHYMADRQAPGGAEIAPFVTRSTEPHLGLRNKRATALQHLPAPSSVTQGAIRMTVAWPLPISAGQGTREGREIPS